MNFIDIFTFLSCLCSVAVLISFQFFVKVRNFGLKLFIFSNFAIFLNHIGIFIKVFINKDRLLLCFFQAFLINFSEISTVSFSGIMSYAFYENLIVKNSSIFLNEPLFFIIGYGFPFILALL